MIKIHFIPVKSLPFISNCIKCDITLTLLGIVPIKLLKEIINIDKFIKFINDKGSEPLNILDCNDK